MLVHRIVIHKDGYQGGMYGEYGGYDFILIQLTDKVDTKQFPPACLPGHKYRVSQNHEQYIGGELSRNKVNSFFVMTIQFQVMVDLGEFPVKQLMEDPP